MGYLLTLHGAGSTDDLDRDELACYQAAQGYALDVLQLQDAGPTNVLTMTTSLGQR